MDLEALNTLLTTPGQALNCKGFTGVWPDLVEHRISLPIYHEATQGLDEKEKELLASQVFDASQIIEFYESFGSLRLYIGEAEGEIIGHPSAFYLAHPDEWSDLKENVYEWLSDLSNEEIAQYDDFPPDWINDFIAFGEIPNSGNYLVMPTRGAEAGKIFEFEHDGLEFVERATDIQGLLDWIAMPAPGLFEYIAVHTRYYDGKSDIQWFPQEFVIDK